MTIAYNSRERFGLLILAVFSFCTVNAAFIYALFFDRALILNALRNPVSAAFIAEAFMLMFALAYLLTKWGVSRSNGRWFIVLSLVGSMGFALPLVLLRARKSQPHASSN